MTEISDKINNECSFIKELFDIGIKEIRKSNFTIYGSYYLAFVCLSNGIERIGKLILLLDHYSKNQTFPTGNEMKKIGHNLKNIYTKVNNLMTMYNKIIPFDKRQIVQDSFYLNVLDILSDFAKGDRYSNIDYLVKEYKSKDSAKRWVEEIDEKIVGDFLSKSKRMKYEKEISEAKSYAKVFDSFSAVYHTSEASDIIDTNEEFLARSIFWRTVSKERQLYLYHIIRYFSKAFEVVWNRAYATANELESEDISFFYEHFRDYTLEDNLAKQYIIGYYAVK